jgi:hypothetical protein
MQDLDAKEIVLELPEEPDTRKEIVDQNTEHSMSSIGHEKLPQTDRA